jgi:hypothetical protein
MVSSGSSSSSKEVLPTKGLLTLLMGLPWSGESWLCSESSEDGGVDSLYEPGPSNGGRCLETNGLFNGLSSIES